MSSLKDNGGELLSRISIGMNPDLYTWHDWPGIGGPKKSKPTSIFSSTPADADVPAPFLTEKALAAMNPAFYTWHDLGRYDKSQTGTQTDTPSLFEGFGGTRAVWSGTGNDINLAGPEEDTLMQVCTKCGNGISISMDEIRSRYTGQRLIPCDKCKGDQIGSRHLVAQFVRIRNACKELADKYYLEWKTPQDEKWTTIASGLSEPDAIRLKFHLQNKYSEQRDSLSHSEILDKVMDDLTTCYVRSLMHGWGGRNFSLQHTIERREGGGYIFAKGYSTKDKGNTTFGMAFPSEEEALKGAFITANILKLQSSLACHSMLTTKGPTPRLTKDEMTKVWQILREALYVHFGMGHTEGSKMGCGRCDLLVAGDYDRSRRGRRRGGKSEQSLCRCPKFSKTPHLDNCPRRSVVVEKFIDDNLVCFKDVRVIEVLRKVENVSSFLDHPRVALELARANPTIDNEATDKATGGTRAQRKPARTNPSSDNQATNVDGNIKVTGPGTKKTSSQRGSKKMSSQTGTKKRSSQQKKRKAGYEQAYDSEGYCSWNSDENEDEDEECSYSETRGDAWDSEDNGGVLSVDNPLSNMDSQPTLMAEEDNGGVSSVDYTPSSMDKQATQMAEV